MNKNIVNADYYIQESQNYNNDITDRKEYCELAIKFYKKALEEKVKCKTKLQEALSLYKHIGNSLFDLGYEKYINAIELGVNLNPTFKERSDSQLSEAISYFGLAKQCGSKEADEYCKLCKKLLKSSIKSQEQEM